MTSSRKEIHTEKLNNVQNAFNLLTTEISNISEGGFDEGVTSVINTGNSAIQGTASLTHGMLNSFDSYLSQVASAFESTDARLAEVIGDRTPETNQDIKNSDAYKKLMSRSGKPETGSVANFRKLDEASR